MRTLHSLLAFLVLHLVLLGSSSEAATYYWSAIGSGSTCSPGSPCASPSAHATAAGDVWVMQSSGGAYHLGAGSIEPPAVSGGSLTSFAELTCDIPLKCSIDNTATNLGVIVLSQSYWKVDGFTLSSTGSEGIVCQPFTAADIQGFLITNNHITSAISGGVATVPYTGGGASNGCDNITITGNVVLDAAISGVACNSEIDVFAVKSYNGGPGGIIRVSGNAVFGPNPALSTPCPTLAQGGTDSDRNCYLDDRDNGSTSNGRPYTGIHIVEGNIFAGCGGAGIKAFNSVLSLKIFRNNTLWHNLADTNYGDAGGRCGELRGSLSSNTVWLNNVVVPNEGSIASGCTQNYALSDDNNGGGISDTENWDQIYCTSGGCSALTGYSLGAKAITQNPVLVNPTIPTAAIDCAGLGYTDVMACYGPILIGYRATSLHDGQGA